MTMSDPITFLHARLDEDEQIAKAAIQGPWHACDHDDACEAADIIFGTSPIASKKVVQVANLEIAWQKRENVAHIIRHDPVRVLAEVEAKRRIIDEHALGQTKAIGEGMRVVDVDVCRTCSNKHGVPCRTVRLLALPYADHPAYCAKWKP